MTPDANGNIKGIRVPRIPWLEEKRNWDDHATHVAVNEELTRAHTCPTCESDDPAYQHAKSSWGLHWGPHGQMPNCDTCPDPFHAKAPDQNKAEGSETTSA